MIETAHSVIDELNSGAKIAPIALCKALGHETVLGSDSQCPIQTTHTIDILSGCEQFACIDEYDIQFRGQTMHGAHIETDIRTNHGHISDVTL